MNEEERTKAADILKRTPVEWTPEENTFLLGLFAKGNRQALKQMLDEIEVPVSTIIIPEI